jgi:2-iminobutanoate/2-iminopropanoate deaminase
LHTAESGANLSPAAKVTSSGSSVVVKLNPPGVARPLGRYSHLSFVSASSLVAVAGQVAVDTDGNIVGLGDVRQQALQAYRNVSRVLEAAGLSLHNVWKLNAYVVGSEAVESFMEARTEFYSSVFPDERDYPPITLIAVTGLAFPELLVEIEALAVIPDGR